MISWNSSHTCLAASNQKPAVPVNFALPSTSTVCSRTYAPSPMTSASSRTQGFTKSDLSSGLMDRYLQSKTATPVLGPSPPRPRGPHQSTLFTRSIAPPRNAASQMAHGRAACPQCASALMAHPTGRQRWTSTLSSGRCARLPARLPSTRLSSSHLSALRATAATRASSTITPTADTRGGVPCFVSNVGATAPSCALSP